MPTKKKNWLSAATKADFIKLIKENSEIEMTTEQAKGLYDLFVNVLKDSIIKEEKLFLNGFGTFKVSKRAARKGRNPRTGEEIEIKASKSVSFKPSPTFKGEL